MRGVPRWGRIGPRQREEQEGGGKRSGLQGIEGRATEKGEVAGPWASARKMTDAAEPAVQWIGESVNDIAVRLRRRDAEYVFSAVDDIAPRCPRPRQSGRNKPRATCEPRPTLRRNLAARTARRAIPTITLNRYLQQASHALVGCGRHGFT